MPPPFSHTHSYGLGRRPTVGLHYFPLWNQDDLTLVTWLHLSVCLFLYYSMDVLPTYFSHTEDDL